MTSPEVAARQLLCTVVEPGDVRVAQLVSELGPESALALLRRGPGPETPPAAVRWRGLYAARLAARLHGPAGPSTRTPAGETNDLRFVGPGDPEWPPGLDELGDGVPIGLWLRGEGRLDQLVSRVAVVGSRAATAYGEHVAADLASGLGARGWTVVSGGAYGIDAAAHRGALAVDAPTVAVLACGLDIAYPLGHHSLFAAIARSGLLVSELPPGEHPTRSRFLRRNRVIAAMTQGTVVVEAALRSGATSTVNHAVDLIRPTMGVPGPVTSPASAGVHQLIRDGQAVLVTDVAEILELLSPAGVGLLERRRGGDRPHDGLDQDDQQILDCLRPRKPTSSDAVADRTGLTTLDVLVRLGRLESRGLIELVEGGWVVHRPSR